ncbi:MAG: diguanylate cyclase domain-containing protein [bacterium]
MSQNKNNFEDSRFAHDSISIGVCEYPADTEKFWQAVKYADVALYEAKESGRNKVTRLAKDMWKEEEY